MTLDIEKYSINDLYLLKEKINFQINKIKYVNKIRFYFEEKQSYKKPFVAKCEYSKSETGNNKRIFFDFDTTKSSDGTVISGHYEVNELDVLDIRKTYDRYYYIVLNKELVKIADVDKSIEVLRVKQYLKGDIKLKTLLELSGICEIDCEVLDELKD